MSKHRDNTARTTDQAQIFVSTEHDDQVAVVDSDTDLVHLSLTPAAAAVLAAVMVRYGSAVRLGTVTGTPADYDEQLMHDIGVATQSASARAFSETRMVSRYVAPRAADAIGRRSSGRAPLTIVGAGQ